ncbi:unnamed protein product [Allacma fusca]|uniref:Uncharacterized protein n=1 Tax=Allacma fusca TaxID=39272 RepID=A0A8J2P2Z5_9HEXA|nr:unnamed protein product [Allacma fusca]
MKCAEAFKMKAYQQALRALILIIVLQKGQSKHNDLIPVTSDDFYITDGVEESYEVETSSIDKIVVIADDRFLFELAAGTTDNDSYCPEGKRIKLDKDDFICASDAEDTRKNKLRKRPRMQGSG